MRKRGNSKQQYCPPPANAAFEPAPTHLHPETNTPQCRFRFIVISVKIGICVRLPVFRTIVLVSIAAGSAASGHYPAASFYRQIDYGSEAVNNPLMIFTNDAFDILQRYGWYLSGSGGQLAGFAGLQWRARPAVEHQGLSGRPAA